MSNLRQQAELVAHLRTVHATAKQLVEERRVEWEKANEQLLAQTACIKSELDDAENVLRTLTLDAYINTGSKRPSPGLGIRIVKRLVYEPTAALAWAKAHDLALALDVKRFEALAKAGQVQDVVRILEEAQPTIATDLAKALADDPHQAEFDEYHYTERLGISDFARAAGIAIDGKEESGRTAQAGSE